MTPEQLAARWLADVPCFDLLQTRPIATMQQEVSGEWMRYDDALAAIARHLAPGDDLVEQAVKYPEILMGYSQGDMDGVMALISRQALHEAADTIRALIALATAQEAQIKGLEKDRDRRTEMHECAMSERDDATLYADEQKARAEAAETALAAMTKERDELATANHRQASCIHVTAANLGPDCSATVDGLPKAARHVAAERDALLGAVKGLVEVLDQHETKGPLPDVALMFCWLAAQNVRAALRGNTLEKPE